MSQPSDPRREAILEAAYKAFALYGYRRTSMEEIARGTGLSRASLYHQFANKEEIFRALVESVHASALDSAEAALERQAPLAERLEDALVARVGRLLDVVSESPHGEEIVDESSRTCGDLVLASSERFQKASSSGWEKPLPLGNMWRETDRMPLATRNSISAIASSTPVVGTTPFPISRSGATAQ